MTIKAAGKKLGLKKSTAKVIVKKFKTEGVFTNFRNEIKAEQTLFEKSEPQNLEEHQIYHQYSF